MTTCQDLCLCVSNAETGNSSNSSTTLGHITEEFRKHRLWMDRVFFGDATSGDPPGLLAAMQLMTEQLTTSSMQQVQIIGAFFDAKHQLETQRLFQQLRARAQKDYHPDQELCEFGTMARSLAASEENSRLTSTVLSKRSLQRQLLSEDTPSYYGITSDEENRLIQFVFKYCNKNDNAGDNNQNLALLCTRSQNRTDLYNRDISYTSSIDLPATLDIDFSANQPNATDDEEAVIALSANLFGHRLFPFVSANKFINPDGTPNYDAAALAYLDVRALLAKRSVLHNSLAAQVALKTSGDQGAQPFIYAMMREMGGSAMTVAEIRNAIGDYPSYNAQMEVLTKLIYQNPEFYSDLHVAPSNIMRKYIATLAVNLMQKRDLYLSYLRNEMILAVMLETALQKEQTRVKNEVDKIK
ncbi:MAG: hypothetical protein R3D88_03865 [Alphaproteobacteria bacterium]